MNKFSPEQLEMLRNNPNVESVTEESVDFTEDFMERASQQMQSGVNIIEFLEQNGIDPFVLGESTIYNLFRSPREEFLEDNSDDDFTSARIEELEEQVNTLTEEVRFLNKLLDADIKAREFWESRFKNE